MRDRSGPSVVAWALLGLALLAALGLSGWFGEAPVPPAEDPPDLPTITPAVRPGPSPAATPAEPKPPPAPGSPPRPAPGQLQAGFCAPEGGDDAITIRRTLPGLLREELGRRLAALAPGRRELLERWASDLVRNGVLPRNLAADEADTALLMAATRGARHADLLDHARRLAAQRPEAPYPFVVAALAAEGSGDVEARLAALRSARRLLPADPALGWALAQATRDGPDLGEAIEGIAAYLAVEPAPPLARLRARLGVQRDLQQEDRRLIRHGVALLWPPESLTDGQADDLWNAIDRGLDEAARFTGSRRRAQLTVVVYPGRSELLAVSCVQSWAGGLYDGTLRLVASQHGEGVDPRALRHETLHAQLSPLAPRAPRWFHEGVAQSFAREGDRARPQWKLMVRSKVWIPFTSLDGSFQIFEASTDADLAYAQSLALVELLRETGGDAAIAEALQAFQRGASTPVALARALRRNDVTGGDLLEFLARRLAQGGP